MWLGDAVAGGGVGVSFDVGSRVFVLSGVSVPESGSGASVSSPAVSGSASASGSVVPVSPGAGVAASEFGSESEPVGSVSSLASLSGSTPVSGVSGGPVPASGAVSVAECGGVRACVPCAVRVFGDGWCFLVLLVWMGREFLGCFLLLLIACLGLVRCLMAPCPCLVLCP